MIHVMSKMYFKYIVWRKQVSFLSSLIIIAAPNCVHHTMNDKYDSILDDNFIHALYNTDTYISTWNMQHTFRFIRGTYWSFNYILKAYYCNESKSYLFSSKTPRKNVITQHLKAQMMKPGEHEKGRVLMICHCNNNYKMYISIF